MRIGILTHHWVYNFGANLQAISTYCTLKKLGHDAWIINYRPLEKEKIYKSVVSETQIQEHEKVFQHYLDQTPLCRTESDIINIVKEYKLNKILVGSDAVFRLTTSSNREDLQYPNPYWLEWTKYCDLPITKSSLAASAMGTNFLTFPASIRKNLAGALSEMQFVSVRDRWTQLMFFLISGGQCRATLCPDPVFVLNNIFKETVDQIMFPFNETRYILLSPKQGTFSSEWIDEFVKYSHKNDMRVVSLPYPEAQIDINVDFIVPLPLSPITWYSLIKNASGFIGSRMHPIICSMVNSVPFLSIDEYGTTKVRFLKWSHRVRYSSKTYDLCSRAGVKNLCLDNQQMKQLRPKNAFDLLFSSKQNYAQQYAKKAEHDFSRVISEILVHT